MCFCGKMTQPLAQSRIGLFCQEADCEPLQQTKDWEEFYQLFYKLTAEDEKNENSGNWGEGEKYILSEMSLYKLTDFIKTRFCTK